MFRWKLYWLMRSFLKRIIPKPLWIYIRNSKRRVNMLVYRDRITSLGASNQNITFYVIRVKKGPVGLFSIFSQVVGSFVVADEKGYIPIVDMSEYESVFSSYQINTRMENPWERFFKQPTNYSLEDIKGSMNVIYSKARGIETYNCQDILNNNHIKYSNVIKKWIKLNDATRTIIDNLVDTLNINNKTLGVFCRGTDYVSLKPKYHPIQPNIIDLVKEVNDYVITWGIEKVYFVTEDKDLYEALKKNVNIEVFGNIKNKINKYKEGTLLYYNKGSNLRNGDASLEYLTDIMILSKCGHFLGSLANGSMAAILLNDNRYINKKILYYGLY